MKIKLYTVSDQFIKEITRLIDMPQKFTGIIEWNDSRYWCIEGKRHRIDGPAVEYYNGGKIWYVHDKECTEEQHKLLVDIMKLITIMDGIIDFSIKKTQH